MSAHIVAVGYAAEPPSEVAPSPRVRCGAFAVDGDDRFVFVVRDFSSHVSGFDGPQDDLEGALRVVVLPSSMGHGLVVECYGVGERLCRLRL